MYCTQCGTKNPDNAKFCYNCGVSMGKPVKTQSSPQKGGFFQRLIVPVIVFALFYGVSYGVTTLRNKDDKPAQKITISEPAITIKTETTPAPAKDSGYIADLDGYWEEVKLQDGSFNMTVSALTFRQKVYNCTSLTVNMDVTMNAGTSCRDWQVWGRTGNTYVKLAKIYLAAGSGEVSQKVTFASPVTIDSIAVTPTIPGSYSWSMALAITDVYTK